MKVQGNSFFVTIAVVSLAITFASSLTFAQIGVNYPYPGVYYSYLRPSIYFRPGLPYRPMISAVGIARPAPPGVARPRPALVAAPAPTAATAPAAAAAPAPAAPAAASPR